MKSFNLLVILFIVSVFSVVSCGPAAEPETRSAAQEQYDANQSTVASTDSVEYEVEDADSL